MGTTLLNIAIVLALILIEALFVASEIALVSLREGQVRALAEEGRRGAAVARLVRDPNRYLSTVQIMITLTSLLSSAFGAVTLSTRAKDVMVDHGVRPGLAAPIGFIGVTLVISFVTLVIGELVPKRLALQRSEQTAKLVSPTLNRLAAFTRPVIWLLSKCTNVLVRMLGGNPDAGHEEITEEELRGLVAAHESLTPDERSLIDEVFAAGNRTIAEVMVPRTEVTFLEASLTVSRALKVVSDAPHSRYPVVGQGQDDVLGFVHIRDEYDVASAGPSRLRGGVVEVDGRLNLDEFAEITDLQLPEGPYETAAGYVMAALGRLPAVGDSVQYDGYEITVTEVDGRRAARVRVTPPKA